MPYYSQQNSLAYEMPNPDQTWQLFPGEELLIGEVESNTIINPVFDAELMANWQMPIPGQIYLSGETFMENAQLPFHAELTAHHWPAPMANHSMQAPSNEGFLSETPSTHHFLRRPSDTESPANQNHISSSQPISVLPCMRTDRGKRCWCENNHADSYPVTALEPLSSGEENTTATATPPLITAPAHPLTGRYPCSYPTCAKDFGRTSDRVRHISSVHQRGQTNQGKNLCPIVGCRRSYGRGLCRPDKVNDHLKKVHGLVRVAQNGASTSAGPFAPGTGNGSNVVGGAAALAGNGN